MIRLADALLNFDKILVGGIAEGQDHPLSLCIEGGSGAAGFVPAPGRLPENTEILRAKPAGK